MDKRIRAALGASLDYKIFYINEVQYFLFETRTGKVKYVHKFLTQIPSIKSRASYLLLKNKLRAQDETYKSIHGVRFKWLKFRKIFLIRHKEIHNSFICGYCGRPDLYNSKKRSDARQVTLDHITPLSKGGKRFDLSNLVICCNICNRIKDSDSLKEFEETNKDYLRGHRKKFKYKG